MLEPEELVGYEPGDLSYGEQENLNFFLKPFIFGIVFILLSSLFQIFAPCILMDAAAKFVE